MKQNIIEYLLSNLRGAHIVSGGKEINCNCPVCRESDTIRRSTRKGGHFYLSIPSNNDEPILYHCKRAVCQAKGILTHQKLIEWSLPIDQDVSIELTQYNSLVMKLAKNYKYKDREIYILNNDIIDSDLSRLKLKYINSRLGLDLTYKDLIDNKITLNLNDIFTINHIQEYTRHPNILQELNDNFLGFISNDNAFVNCNRLVDEGKVYKTIDYKYVKYNIFNKMDNTTSFYTIPSNIDISKPINLRVTEGPYDVLSVKYNLVKSNFNEIYVAIQGSNYLGCIKWYLLNIASPLIDIHIYLDNDVPDSYIAYMKYELSSLVYNVYIHRNLIGKDMGVKASSIKESIEKII